MRQILLSIAMLATWNLFSQQIADKNFQPSISHPAYPSGKGPLVWIDEGHHNFHTKEGRYTSFASLLERDGYEVQAYSGKFTRKKLADGKILVISNALHKDNVENWYLPTYSAFTDKEINVLKQWVKEGGRLWLIADHMPLAGAAKALGAAFGFEFTDGFALDTLQRGPSVFSLENKGLIPNIVTQGRNDTENVTRVVSFTGQAFEMPEQADPILVLDPYHINLLPDTAWVFNEGTRRFPAEGKIQGAYMELGKGRLVVFGEAAMFSAQLAGPQQAKMGMNHPDASQNYQLLLNLIHWLDGIF